MKLKNKSWKIAAFLTVCFLVSNPELMAFGLFIDAVGLELFVLLLEAQVIAVTGYYFTTWFKPVIKPFYRFIVKHDPYFFIPTRAIVKECPALLCHAVPLLVVTIFSMSLTKYSIDIT
jgi:hypothetical protein